MKILKSFVFSVGVLRLSKEQFNLLESILVSLPVLAEEDHSTNEIIIDVFEELIGIELQVWVISQALSPSDPFCRASKKVLEDIFELVDSVLIFFENNLSLDKEIVTKIKDIGMQIKNEENLIKFARILSGKDHEPTSFEILSRIIQNTEVEWICEQAIHELCDISNKNEIGIGVST